MLLNSYSQKTRVIISVLCAFVILSVFYLVIKIMNGNLNQTKTSSQTVHTSYNANIIKIVQDNTYFRRVLFTGQNSQLVAMNIPSGGEVGEETHKYVEQTLFFLSGTGEGALNDRKFPIVAGDVVVVTPGTKHNFWNTGKGDLKIYTVYSPANHIDGRIQKTKADADADKADEAIGEAKPIN